MRALVFRIPRSWNRPHQLVFNNNYRFYGRSSNGKYQIDVDELKNLFTGAAEIERRLETFRAGRILTIASGDTPGGPIGPPYIIWHSVVLPDFAGSVSHRLDQYPNIRNLFPFEAHVFSGTHNLDGFILTNPPYSYTQLYRDMRVEMVRGDFLGEDHKVQKTFPYVNVAFLFLEGLKTIIKFYKDYGAEAPFLFMPSLAGVKGLTPVEPRGIHSLGSRPMPIHEDVLQLPPIYVESIPESSTNVLQTTFDILWQTAGLARCHLYDTDGNWIEGRPV